MFANRQVNELILPPNVNGRCRGQLNVYLKEINWKSNIVNAFYGIQIKFIWWGENNHSAATLCLTNNKSKNDENVLKYSILTRLKLFKHYLLTCEPIEIEFSSVTTNFPIGKAFIRIPKDLINYLKGSLKTEDCSFVNVNQCIVNSQNKNIGDITLGFELIEQKDVQTERINMVMPLVVNKPGAQHKSEKETTNLNHFKSSDIPLNRTILLNYLTGRPLSRNEENKALREMHFVSPSESLVNDLTEEVSTFASIAARNKEVFSTTPTDEKNLFVKIFLYDLTLTDIGFQEILNIEDFSDTVFVVESILDSPVVKRRRSIKRLQVPLSFDFTSKIEINQELVQPICLPANEAQLSLSAITVIFWCKSSHKSRIFGTVYIDLNSLITSNNFKLLKKLSVKSSENADILGTVSINIALDREEILNEQARCPLASDASSTYSNLLCSDDMKINCCKDKNVNKLVYGTSIYDAPKDNPNENTSSVQPPDDTNRNQNGQPEFNGQNSKSSQCEKHQSKLSDNDELDIEPTKDLHGLFYTGLINFDHRCPGNVETFLLCRRFWADSGMFTDCFRSNVINFLEEFPVYCDESFLRRTKQNSMTVEIWQKEERQLERLIGVTSIPLHQFYIAFSNVTVMKHVAKQKLPVVSIDGWSTVMSPETSTPIGTLQVILAIGNDNQINYLKNKRNLTLCSKFLYPPLPHLPIASESAIMLTDTTESLADSETEYQPSDRPVQSDRMLRFSNFLDKLAQSLPPKNSLSASNGLNNLIGKSSENEKINKHSGQSKQVRATSDLLDQLQRALAIPPPTDGYSSHSNSSTKSSTKEQLQNNRYFYAEVQIENAKHLPPVILRECSQSNSVKNQQNSMINEINPSTYVTFKAIVPSTDNTSNYCEDSTYTTNVVENSRSPQWNKKFQVYLPADLLNDSSKRFSLTIWRKARNHQSSSVDDVGIGTVSIDLTVLMNGTPSINGLFSVVDFVGNECGQIKINIIPLEDIKVHRKILQAIPPSTGTAETEPATVQPSLELNFNDIAMDGGLLSRALKRKFTELEEISQRLRSRLLDVNDLPIELDDEFDEFENDLNTVPCDDDNLLTPDSENWLEFCQSVTNEGQCDTDHESKISEPGPSTQCNRKIIDTDLFKLNIQEIENDYTKEKISELLYSAVSKISSEADSMIDKQDIRATDQEQMMGISKALTKAKLSDNHADDDSMTMD